LRLVLEEEPVPPERLRGKTPRDLQTVCLKCLQKEPTARYATAAALADDLERFLDGRPILARPVSRRERIVRWARRHPSTAALAAVTLVAALVLGIVLGRGGAHARERLCEARKEIQASLRQGHQEFGQKDYSAARSTADTVRRRLRGEPLLQDLRSQAEDLFAEAEWRLKKAEALREFYGQRDAALFHGLSSFARRKVLTGRKDIEDWREACAAAARALSLAGNDPAARFGDGVRAQDIAADCFALTLLTAGGEPEGRAALRAIDRSAAGREPTRAYYLRRAHPLKVLGDPAAAPAPERPAGPRAPP